MITGIDISNNNATFLTTNEISPNGFIVLKASEGKTFKDKSFNDFIKKISEENDIYGNYPFLGAYHFARPDNGNSPRDEFNNFCTACGTHIDNMFVALDYEDEAHAIGEKWALEWLSIAQKELHKPPFFYTSAAYLQHYPNIASNFPLWIACYSQDSRTGKYRDVCKNAAILQITSNPIDVDVFKGSMIEMYQYIRGR